MRKVVILLAFFSVLATGLVSYVSVAKQRSYFDRYPFFKDPSEYLQNDVITYESLKFHTKLEVMGEVWKNNFRNPIRSIIPILVMPEALKTPYSHLITSAPYLMIFLFLSSLFVYQRYGSLLSAGLFVCLFASMPFLYNSFYGFAAYWLDLHASFLFASCMLLLVFYYDKQQLIYLLAFGFLCSLEVLGRYNNAIYLFAGGVPILAVIFIKSWEKRKTLALHCGLLALIIGLCTADFLISHLQDNLDYARLGYGLNFSMVDAIKFFFHATITLIGLKVLIPLVFCLVLFGMLFYSAIWGNKEQFVLMLWTAFSSFFVLQIILRNGAHIPSMFYTVVPAIVLIIASVPVSEASGRKRAIMNLFMLLLCGLFSYLDYSDFSDLEGKEKSEEKKFNERVLADMRDGDDHRLSALVGGLSVANLSLESYYGSGKLLTSSSIFGKYDVAWYYYYNSQNVDVVEGRFLKTLDSLSGFALVFAGRNSVDAYFDRASKTAPSEVSRRMALRSIVFFEASPKWKIVESFEHPFYGRIALYRKID